MRVITFLTLALCIYSMSLRAQYDYTLSLASSPYQEKSGGTSAFSPNGWGGYTPFNINLGFNFSFLDTTVNQIILEATSRLVFNPGHNYWLDMTTVVNFQSKTGTNSSPVSIHHLVLSDSSKAMTIQYKNATYADDTAKTINFSITLYERDNSIELHMGPKDDVKNSNAILFGPYLGYYHSKAPSQANFEYGRNWINDLSQKQDTIFSGVNSSFLNFTLNDLVSENQVVRLEPTTSISIGEEKLLKHLYFDSLSSTLYLEKKSSDKLDLEVKNLAGKTIYQLPDLSPKTDLSNLKPACYLFLLKSGNTVIKSQKICVH